MTQFWSIVKRIANYLSHIIKSVIVFYKGTSYLLIIVVFFMIPVINLRMESEYLSVWWGERSDV